MDSQGKVPRSSVAVNVVRVELRLVVAQFTSIREARGRPSHSVVKPTVVEEQPSTIVDVYV